MKPISGTSVLFLIAMIFFSGCTTDLSPRMLHSDYTYRTAIQHKGPLSNATFIIPVPVRNSLPAIGNDILDESFFTRENFSICLTRSPGGLNLTDSGTNPRNLNAWFLVIHLNTPTDMNSGELYSMEKEVHILLNGTEFPVNTLIPVGNESIFMPKLNFVWQQPVPAQSTRDQIFFQPVTIPYQTWIYADYSAPSSSSVEVYSYLEGSNGWEESDDAWLNNHYNDLYSATIFGESHGWHLAEGKLSAAEGIYPNYSSTVWQAVINQTRSGPGNG